MEDNKRPAPPKRPLQVPGRTRAQAEGIDTLHRLQDLARQYELGQQEKEEAPLTEPPQEED